MVSSPPSGRCSAGRPTRSRSRSPTSPTSEPEVSEDGKTITFKIKDGIKLQPAGGPRDHGRRLQVRDRARPAAGRRQRLPQLLLRRPRRLRRGSQAAVEQDPTVAPDISGITTPDDRTLVLKLTEPTAPVGRAGALAADRRPGAGGVREGVRRREPLDLRRARGRHRPLHDRERRRGQPDRLQARARRSSWSATRTGIPSTDYRPAYLDRIEFTGGVHRRQLGRPQILTGDVAGRTATSSPSRRALKLAAPSTRTSWPWSPGRRQPLHRPEHADAAVRRHQRAQGGGRGRRPRGAAPRARRPARRASRHPLHLAADPGFEEAGGEEGFGFDFIAEPERKPGAGGGVLPQGRLRERQVRGRRARS